MTIVHTPFSPLPQGVQEWKSQISIRSRQDSVSEIANSNASSSDWSLAPHLCYACHATLTSRSSRAPPSIFPGPDNPSTTSIELPAWTRARWRSSHSVDIEDGEIVVSKQVSESDMHGVVKDFLLED